MRYFLSCLALILFNVVSAAAGNWPHWRGPAFNGASDETHLPSEFSKTQNIKWVTSLPGPSAATPIIWQDHVFISSTEPRTRTLHAFCIDRHAGKVIWDREVGVGFNLDDKSNYASPS